MKNKKIKKYKNPFFRSKDRGLIKFFKNLSPQRIVLISCFFLLIILILLIFYTNIFKIKHIEINGSNKTPDAEVSDFVFEKIQFKKNFFPNDSIFFLDKKELIEDLKNNYSINFVEIKKIFPNKLFINFLEKEYAFVWFEDDFYYYTDKQGFLISEVSILEANLEKYPLVVNDSQKKKVDKKINLEYNKIEFILNLFNTFRAIEDIKIEKYSINNDLNTVIAVVSESGPELFFNINESIEKQINKLMTVKKEKIKDDFQNKEYIDLRIGDNVYYK